MRILPFLWTILLIFSPKKRTRRFSRRVRYISFYIFVFWGSSLYALVATVKIAFIIKTALIYYIAHVVVSFVYHHIGKVNAILQKILNDRHIHDLLKNAAKMIFTYKAKRCKLLNRQLFVIIRMYFFQCGSDYLEPLLIKLA